MKPPAARVRRKAAGDGDHVLARRLRLDAVVCGWLWPEPELLLRAAGLRWAALVRRGRRRLPAAGLRRDHVRFGLGFVVAENAVFDRRGSARRCRVFAVRAAVYQVTAARTRSAEPFLDKNPADRSPTRPNSLHSPRALIFLNLATLGGWEIKESWVGGLWCNDAPPSPHCKHKLVYFRLYWLLLLTFTAVILHGRWTARFISQVTGLFHLPRYADFTDFICLVFQGQSDMMYKGAFFFLFYLFWVFLQPAPVDAEREMVSFRIAVVWGWLCSLAVMRLDDALKAYLITLVQARYNTVNIIKIKLRPLWNSRDFQLLFGACFVWPSAAKSTYMHVNVQERWRFLQF